MTCSRPLYAYMFMGVLAVVTGILNMFHHRIASWVIFDTNVRFLFEIRTFISPFAYCFSRLITSLQYLVFGSICQSIFFNSLWNLLDSTYWFIMIGFQRETIRITRVIEEKLLSFTLCSSLLLSVDNTICANIATLYLLHCLSRARSSCLQYIHAYIQAHFHLLFFKAGWLKPQL